MSSSLLSLALVCLAVSLENAAAFRGKSINLEHRPHKFVALLEGQEPLQHQKPESASWRAGTTIHLGGGLLTLQTYTTTLAIGTPQQVFTVLLDTGSSNFALPGAACATCSPSGSRYKGSSSHKPVMFQSDACKVCNPSGSSTDCLFGQPYPAASNKSLCGYGISYGGGSSFVIGTVGTDVVEWGGIPVHNASIITMTDTIPSGALTGVAIDGIIGLARETNAVNPTWAPTIFGQMVDAGVPDMFGLCLTPSNGGVLDLGFVDSKKYSGELQYVPLTQDRWYNFGLIDVALNKASIGLPPQVYSYLNDQIGSFIDSGTGVLLFGPVIYGNFKAAFQSGSYCNLPGVCGSSGTIFDGACISDAAMGNKLAEYPDIQLTAQGIDGAVTLTVPSKSYFLHSGGQYCLGVATVAGISAVMGDVVMENYYIVHDRQNERLGFAPVADCS